MDGTGRLLGEKNRAARPVAEKVLTFKLSIFSRTISRRSVGPSFPPPVVYIYKLYYEHYSGEERTPVVFPTTLDKNR